MAPLRFSLAFLTVALGTLTLQQAAAQEHSILTYHGDAARSGNLVVPRLTWDKARSIHMDRAFDARFSGHVYAQPLYWQVPGSNKAMLLVATEANVVEALDAETGKQLWRRSLGSPVSRSALLCGNISPLGITGSPVIDEATQAIYLDAAIARIAFSRCR